MDLRNTQFTFSNKENTHIPLKEPTTPSRILRDKPFANNNNKNNQRTKRVPLGGKDKNTLQGLPLVTPAFPTHAHGLHLSASAQKRAKRLRTPLSKGNNRKLDILRDIDDDFTTAASSKPQGIDVTPLFSRSKDIGRGDEDDDEIEYVAVKQSELPYIPLNYTPFTDEDLAVLKQSPSVRLQDKRDILSDVGSSDEELEVNFNFDDDEEDNDKETTSSTTLPHFMEPTFVSNAKKVGKIDVFHDGLLSADLQRLIDEQ